MVVLSAESYTKKKLLHRLAWRGVTSGEKKNMNGIMCERAVLYLYEIRWTVGHPPLPHSHSPKTAIFAQTNPHPQSP